MYPGEPYWVLLHFSITEYALLFNFYLIISPYSLWCYSRQVAGMSVEIGVGARWQEITHLVNRGGCGQTKKKNLQTDKKPHIWVISVLEADKER